MIKQHFLSLVAGFLFGAGLTLSQMTNPDKIIKFLDFTGNWDPSLAMVMLGALSIALPAFNLIKKRNTPVFDLNFKLSCHANIDKSLLAGSLLFGIGWGVSGYCPGPAIVNLSLLRLDVIIFVSSLILGCTLYRLIFKKIDDC